MVAKCAWCHGTIGHRSDDLVGCDEIKQPQCYMADIDTSQPHSQAVLPWYIISAPYFENCCGKVTPKTDDVCYLAIVVS